MNKPCKNFKRTSYLIQVTLNDLELYLESTTTCNWVNRNPSMAKPYQTIEDAYTTICQLDHVTHNATRHLSIKPYQCKIIKYTEEYRCNGNHLYRSFEELNDTSQISIKTTTDTLIDQVTARLNSQPSYIVSVVLNDERLYLTFDNNLQLVSDPIKAFQFLSREDGLNVLTMKAKYSNLQFTEVTVLPIGITVGNPLQF